MASPLSRRDLFGIFRKSVQAATDKPPLRPPGTVSEERLAQTCLTCGACVEVCPRHAIKPMPADRGALAGTPYIVPREAPCVLCNGLLCTTVCPSGTLLTILDAKDVRMGTAVVEPRVCLPHQGKPCNACVTACPIPGAIVTDEKGRPKVTSACTGCGLCEYYCPTKPAAIQVRPRTGR
jgi:MauM/NapG family ferredoxin protein